MKRTQLRTKELNEQLKQNNLNIEYTKKDQVELVETENYKIILINKEPSFFYYNINKENTNQQQEILIPTLKLLQHKLILKKITVDMGAIKFVINGADIMRPGITNIQDNIQKNEPIVIVDQTHQKPLAIGISQLSTEELNSTTTGKVIKNIHHVGDELWKLELK